ncbi:MAG: peptidase S45 [Bacteroidetes bacterium]|nr:MAG: peptidase S45 [Bacteroidota bacterium]
MKPFYILFILAFVSCATTYSFSQINPESITIARDKWGVPHIYAPKDEEVAYGLAWATCEDNFHNLQENILPVRKRMGEYKGKDGAIVDVFGHLMGVDELVEKDYDKSFSDKFKLVLEGYCAGVNSYAEKHPKEVLLKGIFPVTPKDMIKAYTFSLAFMTHVHYDFYRIFKGHIKNYEIQHGIGSNGMAVSSSRTKDGKTYLAINSHQPLEGPFAWYEAHLMSDEGLNILGANFPGGVGMMVGVNENLGWGHTLNYPDLDDVYKLTMHPTEKLKYKYDGKWETLEERPIKMKVKVLGFLKIRVKQKFYWSKYGTTIKNDDGFYSVRFPANMDIRAAEQWYHMNKARNFEEFSKALDMQAFPGINIVYADREDNIYYLSNGLFAYRNPAYDWTKVLPGDTSATLWEPKWHPREDLPQILNPECGYLVNTNNTPFNVTCPENNLDPEKFDKTMGFLTDDNNRSLRYHELIANYDKLSYDDFKNIKYDLKFATPAHNNFMLGIEKLLTLDPTKFPDMEEEITMLLNWDRSTDIKSEPASLALLAIKWLVDEMFKRGQLPGVSQLDEAIVVEALTFAKEHLKKHFKTVHVPLGDMQRHIRGDVSLPVGGGPDILAAMHVDYHKKGILKSRHGDSYIELVRFSKDGVEIETVNAYGASNKEDSPHYTDQMEMYVNQRTKTMTLDREKVMAEAVRKYHPQ